VSLGRTLARIAAFSLLTALVLLVAAPAAFAADGVGLAGRTDDKTITFFCFGVIAFFPILVTALSLIQGRLEKRKERRRYDLERLS
jgi:hypothetical protein